MATNPRIPERRDPELERRLQRNAPRGGAPWVLGAILVAVAILVALLIWLPRAPKAGAPPQNAEAVPQPTADQIQISGLRMSAAPVGNTVAVDGMMFNNGDTDITGVAVNGTFEGQDGRNLGVAPAKVEAMHPDGTTADLVSEPIKARQQTPVRMTFENIPDGWNHQLPSLAVTTVTAVGNGAGAKQPPSSAPRQ